MAVIMNSISCCVYMVKCWYCRGHTSMQSFRSQAHLDHLLVLLYFPATIWKPKVKKFNINLWKKSIQWLVCLRINRNLSDRSVSFVRRQNRSNIPRRTQYRVHSLMPVTNNMIKRVSLLHKHAFIIKHKTRVKRIGISSIAATEIKLQDLTKR